MELCECSKEGRAACDPDYPHQKNGCRKRNSIISFVRVKRQVAQGIHLDDAEDEKGNE